jgi:hypothetical protein
MSRLQPILHVTVDITDMTTMNAAKFISDVEEKFKKVVEDRTVVVTSSRVSIHCSHNE